MTCAAGKGGVTDPVIWICGAGRFGRLAAERFAQHRRSYRVTVIDHSPEVLQDIDSRTAELHCGDCVAVMDRRLTSGEIPEWIVPAVPVHLVCDWLFYRQLPNTRLRILPVPTALIRSLPNAVAGSGGAVYTSIADFVCPDNCPAPEDHCTVTGRPRPLNVHRTLERIDLPGWHSIAVKSHQLMPGVGGIRGSELLSLPKRVADSAHRVVLSTACACHGVVHALAVSMAAPSH